jgi:uncharacterized protein (TIGR00251 family)
VYQLNDDGSITLAVHARPGAGRTEITGRHGDALKVRVAAPPEGGRANEALRKTLAEALGVDAGAVKLEAGEHSRSKRFRIADVDADEIDKVMQRLVAGPGPGPGTHSRERFPR